MLHIKITMIRCLLNLLDDFTVLRRSGWNVSADVPILRRSNWLLAPTIFSKLFRFAPFSRKRSKNVLCLAVHISLVSSNCIKHSVAKDRIVWNRYRKRKWQNLLRNFRQKIKINVRIIEITILDCIDSTFDCPLLTHPAHRETSVVFHEFARIFFESRRTLENRMD